MDISLNMLRPLEEEINLIGDPVRGAGWYGHTTGLHTVAISVQNFQGRILVQASIATDPGEADWFSVLPDGVAYLQYPRTGYVIQPNYNGETSLRIFNFVTNAVWLQASVQRSYLIPSIDTPLQIMMYGRLNYVMVNY
jgi:hypothetical protein